MNAEQIGMFDGSKRYKIRKPIRLIELFAGIGSQAKALQNIGADFEHYRICEFDKYAVQSYNAVHGTNFKTSDITKITAADLGIVETNKYEYIMTYSFPCTDLSKAGQQKGMAKGSGTRSGLLWEVERLLDECEELPQVLLMENVPDVIGTKNISHFANWIKKLETLGYHNYWKLLNAKDYGIPQNRNRCFMVSVLGDYYYNFPQGFPLELRLKDMLEEKVDEKYYLSDKQINYISKQPKNYACKINPEISNCLRTNYGTASSNESYISDGNRGSKIIEKSNIKNIMTETASTLGTNCGSSTSAGSGVAVTNDLRIRKLTPKECWRLMGFTDSDFDKAKASGVSNSQLYKQAGNSIVVNVLEEIFKQMQE